MVALRDVSTMGQILGCVKSQKDRGKISEGGAAGQRDRIGLTA